MRRNKRTKVIMIVALVIAIVGMSIGFATFSSVLTISSRATVTPDTNFKMTIYGALNPWAESLLDIDMSDTRSVFWGTDNVKGSDAIIDNENFTISNISFEVGKPGQLGGYLFGVVNEGNKSSYVKVGDVIDDSGEIIFDKSCQALSGTSQTLVDANCESIGMKMTLNIVDVINMQASDISEYELEDGYYEIAPGMGLVMQLVFAYGSYEVTLADGPFEVHFEDITFEFLDSIPENVE